MQIETKWLHLSLNYRLQQCREGIAFKVLLPIADNEDVLEVNHCLQLLNGFLPGLLRLFWHRKYLTLHDMQVVVCLGIALPNVKDH